MYYETTYSNYVKKQEKINEYQDSEPMGDLLLESQRNPQVLVKKQTENVDTIHEE